MSQKDLKASGISVWQDYHDPKDMRQFGTIVLSPMSSKVIINDNAIIEKEIVRALEEGGHICILCDTTSKDDLLIGKILLMISCRLIDLSGTVSEVDVRQSEFTEFLRNYGTVSNVFVANDVLSRVICTMSYVLLNPESQNELTKIDNNAVVGFTVKKKKGLVTILPFHLYSSVRGDELGSAIIQLSKALVTHRKNLVFDPPNWINSIKLRKEQEIEVQLLDVNQKVLELQNILSEQFRLKSILWLKNKELDEECRNVLQNIGIVTNKNDIGEEDFWILNNGSPVVICETKGKDNNLLRADINKLDDHREARHKENTFPAVLIVNSFNTAKSIIEKEVPIPSNVIEHAVNQNMLVLRTLDVVRLLDMHQEKNVSTETILNYFTTHAGWMKVTDKIEVLKK